MQAFRFPSYDYEQSKVHDHVATSEFLMMLHSEFDKMILQQEIETIHASNVHLLLYSQPVGLGLLVELLTSGVESITLLIFL